MKSGLRRRWVIFNQIVFIIPLEGAKKGEILNCGWNILPDLGCSDLDGFFGKTREEVVWGYCGMRPKSKGPV